MSKLREKLNSKKNPGIAVMIIGFFVAALGFIVGFSFSDSVGELLFTLGFIVTAVGILITVTNSFRENINK